MVPDLLRGRSSLPAAVQAAQHHARAARPEVGLAVDALAARAARRRRRVGDGRPRRSARPAGSCAVTVAQRPHAAPALLTCAAAAPRPLAGTRLADRPDPRALTAVDGDTPP